MRTPRSSSLHPRKTRDVLSFCLICGVRRMALSAAAWYHARQMSTCVRRLLFSLGAVLILLTGHAAGKGDVTSPWVGAWMATETLDGQLRKSRIELTPTGHGLAITRDRWSGVIRVLTANRLEAELETAEGKLTLVVSLKNQDLAIGTFTVRGPAGLTEGALRLIRVHAFGGFFLAGPTRLRWGESATYTLQYTKAGERKRWLGAIDHFRLEGGERFGIQLAGQRGERRLITSEAKGRFQEATVEIHASGKGGAPWLKNLQVAVKIVTITNVPNECANLRDEIERGERALADFERRRRRLEAQQSALVIPPGEAPANRDAAIAEFEKRVASERKALQALEDTEDEIVDSMSRARQARIRLYGVQRAIRASTTALRACDPVAADLQGVGADAEGRARSPQASVHSRVGRRELRIRVGCRPGNRLRLASAKHSSTSAGS